MRRRVLTVAGALGLMCGLLLTGWPTPAAADEGLCRLDNYFRESRPPDQCPGQQKQGGLCYDACRRGYDGVGPVCWKRCKRGYHDDGATCRRDAHIFASDTSACPWYDACGLTFARGCSECPDGYHNDGCTCRRDVHIYAKHSYGRGAGDPMSCRDGWHDEAGVCYPECHDGYLGVGPVCWAGCPADRPVRCARVGGCGTSEAVCEDYFFPGASVNVSFDDFVRNSTGRPARDPRSRDPYPRPGDGAEEAEDDLPFRSRIRERRREYKQHILDFAAAAGRDAGPVAGDLARMAINRARGGAGDWHEIKGEALLAFIDSFHVPQCGFEPERRLICSVRGCIDSATGERVDAMIADRDGDGWADARDGCPDHGAKHEPGQCGCDFVDEADADGDGEADCQATLTLRVEGEGGGRIDSALQRDGCAASCRPRVTPGQTVELTAVAERGARVVGWLGACAGQGEVCTVDVDVDTYVGVVVEPAD